MKTYLLKTPAIVEPKATAKRRPAPTSPAAAPLHGHRETGFSRRLRSSPRSKAIYKEGPPEKKTPGPIHRARSTNRSFEAPRSIRLLVLFTLARSAQSYFWG